MDEHKENRSEEDAAKIVNTEPKKRTCFVVMPISDSIGYDVGHFKRVYDHLIKPACEQAGYEEVVRADDIKSSHLIMVSILKQVLEADMVVCDLSARNPNVLYELAIRQCFDLPVTLIRDTKTAEPFDIAGIHYVEYDKELRYDLVLDAIARITASIRDTERKKGMEVTSLLQLLGRSKAIAKPSDQDPIFYTILDEISSIKASMKQNASSLSALLVIKPRVCK